MSLRRRRVAQLVAASTLPAPPTASRMFTAVAEASTASLTVASSFDLNASLIRSNMLAMQIPFKRLPNIACIICAF